MTMRRRPVVLCPVAVSALAMMFVALSAGSAGQPVAAYASTHDSLPAATTTATRSTAGQPNPVGTKPPATATSTPAANGTPAVLPTRAIAQPNPVGAVPTPPQTGGGGTAGRSNTLPATGGAANGSSFPYPPLLLLGLGLILAGRLAYRLVRR